MDRHSTDQRTDLTTDPTTGHAAGHGTAAGRPAAPPAAPAAPVAPPELPRRTPDRRVAGSGPGHGPGGGPGTGPLRTVADRPAAVPGEHPRPDADARPAPSDRLLDTGEAEGFRRRWHDVQAAFVDDPGDAVRRADELTGEAVDALGRALAQRRLALSPRDEDDAASDTERLRLALREYRTLLDRVLGS
ncbi:hypothetical protein BTM25_53700 [Actinomadura rubteroloni]|uniref:Uncharacterized protein n=1 Tax=Actinomadura rubteroloni TaxID=1926885 RepID=A0A2P4UBJ6_9ACTN|nr:hypothetical protein [Actinomadura rubteroloni]POM22420.1 hypothetical protein BTM25_53700 [Actinomadura rubteroloni]